MASAGVLSSSGRSCTFIFIAALVISCGRNQGSSYWNYASGKSNPDYNFEDNLSGTGSGSGTTIGNGIGNTNGDIDDGEITSEDLLSLQTLLDGLSSAEEGYVRSNLEQLLEDCSFLFPLGKSRSLRLACEGGNKRACVKYALLFPSTLFTNYLKEITKQNALSASQLRQMFVQAKAFCRDTDLDSNPERINQLIEENKRSCQQGNLFSCFSLIFLLVKLFLKTILGLLIGLIPGI